MRCPIAGEVCSFGTGRSLLAVALAAVCGACGSGNSNDPVTLRDLGCSDGPACANGASTGGAPADGETDPSLPSGCEFLGERAETPLCTSGQRCEQVQSEDRDRTYSLAIPPTFTTPGGERVFAADIAACLERWLRAEGATQVVVDGDTVHVTAPWAVVQPAAESASVSQYGLDCVQSRCDYCEDLGEEQCRADSFCSAHEGYPIDETEGCTRQPEFAGCAGGNLICAGINIALRGPDGRCWSFGSGCSPPGFTSTRACETYANAAACPDPL